MSASVTLHLITPQIFFEASDFLESILINPELPYSFDRFVVPSYYIPPLFPLYHRNRASWDFVNSSNC